MRGRTHRLPPAPRLLPPPLSDDARRTRFEALAEQVWVPVQRYLLRRTDPETTQDLLSDVLLVLWRRLDDVPEDPLPWAYGVARGCLANARRSEARRLRLLQRVALEPVLPPPGAEAGAEEDVDLPAALATLSPSDQELLRLWAWEQLAPREIALVLGTTAPVVSVRLNRAKTRLRRACKTAGGAGQEQGRRDEEAPR